jgi:predicted DNA-binding transcriptional regulator AlpA
VAELLSPLDQLLTTAEAAALLRLSRRTLEDFRVAGTGPRYFKLGPHRRSRVVYRKVDLETWFSRFGFSSTSEYGKPT